MEPRLWFMEGETFTSPDWKQQGKPFQINREIKKKYVETLPRQEKTLLRRFWERLWNTATTQTEPEPESEPDETEDQQLEEEDDFPIVDNW